MRRGTQEALCIHLNPRARGRTRPLGRPRLEVLRPLGWVPPRDEAGTRDCRESEVANFLGVGLEAVAGFSTKDMSVVLSRSDCWQIARSSYQARLGSYMNVVSPSASPRSVLRARAYRKKIKSTSVYRSHCRVLGFSDSHTGLLFVLFRSAK